MRILIRHFDRLLRWANGVFEFCAQEECLLRLQLARASHDLHLSDGTRVRAGEPVLMLHMWNEHVPPLEVGEPDLAWAMRFRHLLIHSLQLAARWLASQPGLAGVRAIGGVTVLLPLVDERGSQRLMRRLGFDVFPHQGALGRFGEFWENLYSWGLMWTFNGASLRHRSLLSLRRAEIWMPAERLVGRYGVPEDQ